MNERIKELAEQAGYTPLPGFDFANDLQEVFLGKFAELIVRECADIAKHHVMNISTYADAEFVEEQIAKHFGVKS